MPQLEALHVVYCRAIWDVEDEEMLPPPRVSRLSRLTFFPNNTPLRFMILTAHIDAPDTLRRYFFWFS